MHFFTSNKYFRNPTVIFFLFFIPLCIFFYDSVLDKGPMSTHMWRQTDCLSITKNYYEGAPFLEPELHAQLGDKNTSGKSAGEFPILYYIVAQIWKITGVSEMMFRIFYLLILISGLFAFYKTLQLIFKNTFWSICLSVLLFTSPILVVYGVSFLTDAPAFCFILISGYFLTRYVIEEKNKWFLLAFLFLSLAGLIKISNLFFFAFILGIFLLEKLKIKSLSNRNFFKHNWLEIFGFSFVIIIIYAWYAYAASYNEMHGFKYTFNDIFPIWDMPKEKIEPWLKGMKEVTSHSFFSRAILFSFLFIGIFNFSLYKKIPLFAYLANIIIILGATIYFCLWGPLFINHDYYYLALLILFPAILLPFVYYVKANFPSIFTGKHTQIFLSIFLVFNVFYCKQMIQLKTTAETGYFVLVGNQRYVEEMRWINWEYKHNWMRFRRCIPYMEKIGIKKDDKIISLPDFSFSISLYLMDHKGWTNYLNYSEDKQIQELVNKGAKYLIISQPEIENQTFLQNFIKNPIGEYEGLKFYKL